MYAPSSTRTTLCAAAPGTTTEADGSARSRSRRPCQLRQWRSTAFENLLSSFGGIDWFSDGRRLLAGTDRGIEIVTLGPPVGRTLLKDSFALMDVDLSPDDKSVAYSINGQSSLFVLSGF